MLSILISGGAIGLIYSAIAIGYNMTWLTSRVINFAYAAFIVTGMFLSVVLYDKGVPFAVTLLILLATGAALAGLEYVLAILPVMNRGDNAELVTTIGVTTLLQGTIYLFVVSAATRVPSITSSNLISIRGGGNISWAEILVIAVVLLLGFGMHAWGKYTKTGLAALAQSEDRDAALILGVRPKHIATAMFVTSGMIAFGLAPVVGPVTFAVVGLAIPLAIKGFVALALGGVGSQTGALLGGLTIGILEAVVARHVDVSFQNLSIYILFLGILLLRPQGLFGGVGQRTV